MGARTPRIALQIVTLPENRGEGEALLARWRERLRPTDFVKRITPSSFAGQIAAYRGGGVPLPAGGAPIPSRCRWIGAHAVIFWDGTMTVCPNDYEGTLAVGNVEEATIEALWRGAALSRLRRLHRSGVVPPGLLCHGCPDFRGAEEGRFRYSRVE